VAVDTTDGEGETGAGRTGLRSSLGGHGELEHSAGWTSRPRTTAGEEKIFPGRRADRLKILSF
jgi:hypothetical protein